MRICEYLPTKTLGQALLMQYLVWCRENKEKVQKERDWIQDVVATFKDKKVFEKAFPELIEIKSCVIL